MRYLTYEEYTSIGGLLEKNDFEHVIDRTCGIVDLYTQARLKDASVIPDRVLSCIRDLCEYLVANKASGTNGTVASRTQSAGGVSESESYTSKTADEFNAEMLCIIYDYLITETDDYGTPLLYRGCRA